MFNLTRPSFVDARSFLFALVLLCSTSQAHSQVSLAATAVGPTQISLNWQFPDAGSATAYMIYQYNAGGFWLIDCTGTGVTTYTVGGLSPTTTYTFKVYSFDVPENYAGCGQVQGSNESNQASATTPGYPPNGAPSALSATAVSGSQINLSWVDGSSNETGFKIERKTGATGTYSQIAIAGANVTSYGDAGLVSSTTYYYRVRATNSWGDSGYTNEASALPPTLPSAPSGLSAASPSATQINLSWSDNSSNESDFKIERKTDITGTYAQIATVSANTTSYVDTGLSPSTPYYYRVRANNVAGDSAYSNEANATTGTPPAAPSALNAAALGQTQTRLIWTDNANNETGFKIERKTGAGGTYAQIGAAATDATSYSDSGLTAATTYYYRVRATNLAADSGYSNEASVTTPPIADATTGTVEYTYDPFGNLIQTNAGGIVTTLTYDLRGRKIAMSDPDMGNWTYAYNALGELVSQTDAKGNVATIAYDVLGRTVSRQEADLISTWTYDSCTMGVGKPCSTTADNGYARSYTYDTLGRPASVSTTIDAAYVVTMAYDTAGRVATVTYPDGFATKNVYNAFGYLSEVHNNADGSLFWQAQAVSATGRVTQELLGNTLTTTRTYDILDRLTGITASGTPGTAQSVGYTYDALGNLTQRTDATQNNLAEYFYYDGLNRLTASSGPGLTSRAYEYDALGNITYKSDVGSYSYGAKPHAVSSVSGTVNASYTYDANGNLVSGAGRALTYSSFNLPLAISEGTTAYQYTYDVDHERVRLAVTRATGNSTIIYLNSGAALLYEKETHPDGTIEYRHYVTGGAGLVGVYVTKSAYAAGDGPGMRYFHLDHLGSVSVITNGSGAVVERLGYEAFGKRRFPNGTDDPNNTIFGVSTERGFTGHEHLDELQLIHMNGRVYDPLLGRFMTADPFIQSPRNLQSYNRYTYGFNNPLRGTDPSGFAFFDQLERFMNAVGETVGGGFANFMESGAPFVIVAAWIGGVAGADYSWAIVADTACYGGTYAGLGIAVGVGLGTDAVTGNARQAWAAFAGTLLFNVAGDVTPYDNTSPERLAAHAGAGCAMGAIGRTGCGPQAFAAIAGHVSGVAASEAFDSKLVGGFVSAAVAGGTASKLGGGKFGNGAITAAYGYLFNYCAHNGCWTTSEERAYLDRGDFLGYYSKACEGGDLNTCFFYGVASGERPGPSDILLRGLLANGYSFTEASSLVRSTIPLNLANDYANLLPQSESQAAFPNAQAVADYHWSEFAKYGLPPSTFGGTPFDKSLVLPSLWCPLCVH